MTFTEKLKMKFNSKEIINHIMNSIFLINIIYALKEGIEDQFEHFTEKKSIIEEILYEIIK